MGKILKTIIPLAKIAAVILLIYGTYFYFNNYQKEALQKFYFQVDVWGITDVGRAELDRKYKINELDIPFAQRQALINKTVFFGATSKMVLLALGEPAERPVNTPEQQIWVYYFDDYSRPTQLFFIMKDKQWVLNSAEKGQ